METATKPALSQDDCDDGTTYEALTLSQDDCDDGTTYEALTLSTIRESLRSLRSLRSRCGACFLRDGSRALALRVRQDS